VEERGHTLATPMPFQHPVNSAAASLVMIHSVGLKSFCRLLIVLWFPFRKRKGSGAYDGSALLLPLLGDFYILGIRG
jgi:hypothetical protein